jgi:cell division transport system permease protein
VISGAGTSAAYFFKEGVKALKNNIATTIGSIVTIFLSLFIIGLFILGNSIMGNIANAIESQVSITAYVGTEATPEQINEITESLKAMEGVSEVGFTTKEQALINFKETMSSSPEIVDQLNDENNPLPASIEVELSDPKKVDEIAVAIQENETFKAICDSPARPADSVKYGQKTVERLFGITDTIRNVGAILVVLLIFIAFVFMNNTIRLAVMNRRKEISIQRLVGASNNFIRGPFLAEGIIHALIGGVLAIISLEVVHYLVLPKLSGALAWLPLGLDLTTYILMYVFIVGAGLLIGIIGSSLAMKKYLTV